MRVGVAMTDLSTGLYAHGAIMAALLDRQHTGYGQRIQCNLLSSQVGEILLGKCMALLGECEQAACILVTTDCHVETIF